MERLFDYLSDDIKEIKMYQELTDVVLGKNNI